jgi:hypothetical protein
VAGDGEALTDTELRDWPKWEPTAKVELWRKAHQMEADIRHHVDKSLVFENFYHQVSHAVD